MTTHRLNRLFDRGSGRTLVVAADHALAGRAELIAGLEDMTAVVDAVVDADPDAVLLTPGQAPLLQRWRGRDRPGLLLRADATNIHGGTVGDDLFTTLVADPVGQALRLDAVGVVVNLYDAEGHDALRRASMDHIATVAAAAAPVGMPVIVEPFVYRPDHASRRWEIVDEFESNLLLCRQAVELGADVIKADATPRPDGYAAFVTAVGAPVLVRGGGRVDDDALPGLFDRTAAVLAGGARGLVYGRNVIKHPDPRAMVAALRALVHDDASPTDALAVLSGDAPQT